MKVLIDFSPVHHYNFKYHKFTVSPVKKKEVFLMFNDTSRFSLTIPSDMAKRADALKKNFFYDKSYAEMYRHLIHLGMNELTKDKTQNA